MFLSGNESAISRGGGRILLGDNTDGEVVMQLPIRCQRAGVWNSTGLPSIYTYS
jgi:hypothetical protein